jgi:hypothetical protein
MVTQDNIPSNGNKNICDGLGCFSEATNTIEEEVGDIGMIRLELCDDCVIKFREQ